MRTQGSSISRSDHAVGSNGRSRDLVSSSGLRWPSIVNLYWGQLLAISVFASLIRLLFFPGGLGSDEIVYLTHAYHLLQGDYLHTSYIGGMRDAINAFLAASLWLFGKGIAGAGGLFFACSLGQVILAYCFAHHLWGPQAALWAGLAMAALPIEVTQAGNLNPDPYLGLVIASSIITFYFAERDNRPVLHLVAGLLAGWVYWIKQVVVLYSFVFVFFVLANRRWRKGWLWFMFGAALLLIAQLILFRFVYGDTFYFFKANYRFILETHIYGSNSDTSLWRYLMLLFVDIYHTGVLGWLALAACMLAFRRIEQSGLQFVLIWCLGLIFIFSAFPISLWPPKFIAKQSNYLDIFMMPLALLTGWFLAQQRRGIALVLGGAMVACGILLSAMEQQVVRVVTVNGRAAAEFAEAHAGTPVFGPLTAQRQSMVERLLHGSLDTSGDIRPWADLSGLSLEEGSAGDVVAYLIDDPQMRIWPDAAKEAPLSETLRRCLVPLGTLEQGDLGLGRSVVTALRDILSVLPAPYGAAALRATNSVWQVAPAQVFAVTRECAREAQGKSAWRLQRADVGAP